MQKLECYVETRGTRTVILAPSDQHRLWYITQIDVNRMTIDCKTNLDDAMVEARAFMNKGIDVATREQIEYERKGDF